MSRITTKRLCWLLNLFFLATATIANPLQREGWPYRFPGHVQFDFHRTQTISSATLNGRPVIAASTNVEVALLDLSGNVLRGWPVDRADGSMFWISGPAIGKTDQDHELNLYMIRGSLLYRQREVVKFNPDGSIDTDFNFSFDTRRTNSNRMGSSPAVLADIDNDGLEEILFTADSLLFAVNGDGTVVNGFPWYMNGRANWFLPPAVVWDIELETTVLLYATYSALHARPVNSPVELVGWPWENNGGLFTDYAGGILILPHPASTNGWVVALASGDSTYALDRTATPLPGFPLRNHGRDDQQVYFIAACDIEGDDIPELVYKSSSPEVHAINLNGQYLAGYPTSFPEHGFGEPVTAIRKPNEWATLTYASMVEVFSALEIYSARGDTLLERFPLDYDDGAPIHTVSKIALIVEEGLVHLVLHSSHQTLNVWDWFIDTNNLSLEWLLPNGTAGGNMIYSPTIFGEITNHPPHPFYRTLPVDGSTVPTDMDIVLEWEAFADPDGDDIHYLLRYIHGNLDSTIFLDEPFALVELELINPDTPDTLSWIVYASDGVDSVRCINGWGEFTISDLGAGEPSTAMLPDHFLLHTIYPNPFNKEFFIEYDLPHRAEVRILLYDLLGRQVVNRQLASQSPGRHRLPVGLNGLLNNALSSGVYFLQVRAVYSDNSHESQLRKVVYLK